MADDKVRELAARIGMLHGDCRSSSVDAFGATIDGILRAELKPLLDAAWEVKGPRGTCDENCDVETCPYMRLAAELQHWRKD